MRELKDHELGKIGGGLAGFNFPWTPPLASMDEAHDMFLETLATLVLPDAVHSAGKSGTGRPSCGLIKAQPPIQQFSAKPFSRIVQNAPNTQDKNYKPATLSYKTPYLNR